jgi:hypothetical protein
MHSGASPAGVLADARTQVAELDERLVTVFSDCDLVEGLAAVQELKGQLWALEARLLAEADLRDLARKQLHWGSTTDWFTHLAGLTRREGRRAVVHARQLVAELPDTLESLRRGAASPAQAAIICDAVDALPSSPALRARGEQALLEESPRLNATDLAARPAIWPMWSTPTAASAATRRPSSVRSVRHTPVASCPSPTTVRVECGSRDTAAARPAPWSGLPCSR